MPERLDDLLRQRAPTPERPLEGQTILAIEDSRFASEALRLLSIRSGARVRRADSLQAAARHLATYRPTVAIVDLGLPDGDGCALIRELAAARPRIAAIVAISGDDDLASEALAAGADAFLAKPLNSLAQFQATLISVLPVDLVPAGLTAGSGLPTGLRAVHRQDHILPDRIALRDDLAQVDSLLAKTPDVATLAYIAQFVDGLGRVANDTALSDAARAVAAQCRAAAASEGGADAMAAAITRLRQGISSRLSTRETV